MWRSCVRVIQTIRSSSRSSAPTVARRATSGTTLRVNVLKLPISLSLLTLILPCPESEKVNEDSRNPEGFNFYAKCKLCNRENSMDIIPGTNAVYTSDDTGKLKTIVQFDCRGLEPFAFSPRTGWLVKSADGGPSFTDVDLSEDDWVEYDTKNDVPVAVYEFKSEFVKLKK